MRTPSIHLSEMIDAVESIEDFTRGMDEEEFLGEEKTKSAVVRQFDILGEATKALPESVSYLHLSSHGAQLQECGTELYMLILLLMINWYGIH